MQRVLQLDPRDNVLIALADLKQGQIVEHAGEKYALLSNVSAKHKFATQDLTQGAPVTMYGVLVGKTSQPVRRGDVLTTANLHHEAAAYHEKTRDFDWRPPDTSHWTKQQFFGYARSDGQVGTRNYWVVVPLVFCENRNILNLKQAFEEELGFSPEQNYRRQVAELAQLYREGKTELIRTHTTQQNGPRSESKKLFPQIDGIRFLLH